MTPTFAGGALRPADVCRALLAALDASEGRRRRRKRDQTPDAFGLGVKRDLLRSAVEADPAPEEFEGWLLEYPATRDAPELVGPALAMARAVFEEWKLAHALGSFRQWLEEGAPSADSRDLPAKAGSHTETAKLPAEAGSHTETAKLPAEAGSHTEAAKLPAEAGSHSASVQLPAKAGSHAESYTQPLWLPPSGGRDR